MAGDQCPSRDQLSDFALGKLDPTVCDVVADHLGNCPECQAVIIRADRGDDPLLAALERGRNRGGNQTADTVMGTMDASQPPVIKPIESHHAPLPPTLLFESTPFPRATVRSHATTRILVKHPRHGPVRTRPSTVSNSKRLLLHRSPKWSRAFLASAVTHAALLVIGATLAIPAIMAAQRRETLDLDLQRSESLGVLTLEHEEVAAQSEQDSAVGLTFGTMDSFGANQSLRISPPAPPVEHLDPDGVVPTSNRHSWDAIFEQRLFEPVPGGAAGRPREVVDGYEDALHRLTAELLDLLEESSLLVIWCFDRSESMQDDREEILVLLHRIYGELQANKPFSDHTIESAVTSFGLHLVNHTPNPVNNAEEVLQAARGIASENSGIERMCTAIGRAIEQFQSYARIRERRLVLVLVSDEAGEREDNLANLEVALQFAKKADCRIYIFGREAVFGHHTAFVNWSHPRTGNNYPLPINRGPESPLVEQLQTDGFRPRSDAYPSGFGPYEQCRLTQETGGAFFLLPDEETNLARDETRRFKLQAVREYQPFLGPRSEYRNIVASRPLPGAVLNVVTALDPFDAAKSKSINLNLEFPPQFDQFQAQALENISKANIVLTFLEKSLAELDRLEPLRDQEPSLRWRANYDLLRAQSAAYIVRLRQYNFTVEQFLQSPPHVPLRQPPNLELGSWRLVAWQATLGDPQVRDQINRAIGLLQQVVEQHPDTPWASRAEWELTRGQFGFVFRPYYTAPAQNTPQELEIPKL